MRNTVLARRYAGALFDLAQERNILDTIAHEVALFEDSLENNAGFRLFLYSQDISKREKREKIEKALQDQVSNVFFNFLLVLLKKNRERVFSDIAREFQRLVDLQSRKIRAATTTAVALDEKTLSDLKAALDRAFDADVQIDHAVDETILGGIVVNVDGQLLDGSLQSQLRRLKSQLLERTNSN